jgi:hypothetical protein
VIQSFLTPAALFLATSLAMVVTHQPEMPPVGAEATRPAKQIGERPRAPRIEPPTVVVLENGDPFRAYEQGAPAAKRSGAVVPAVLTFQGTMGSGTTRCAIIGGKKYRAGDAFGDGGAVVEVQESRVVIRDEHGNLQELRLKQSR